MAKQFYTEKDIEDLVQSGVKSLQVNDDIVLTELAYEKARRLGLQLITELPDGSPATPVRPYLSENKPVQARPQMDSVSQAVSQPAITPAAGEAHPGESQDGRIRAVEQRIRSAVIAKLGDQVDAKLLDDIIHRVVRSTGLK